MFTVSAETLSAIIGVWPHALALSKNGHELDNNQTEYLGNKLILKSILIAVHVRYLEQFKCIG